MSGAKYNSDTMAGYSQRIHNGESITHLGVETGISTTTILKYYRDWCIKNNTAPRKPEIIKRHVQKPVQPIGRGQIVTPHRNTQSVVLVIPDLHCPSHHPDALDFLRAVKAKFHPNKFVCLGDEMDAAAFSRYPKDPDGLNPGQELRAAIDALTPFYLEFPDMLVCESNHTVRPFKKAFEAGLPSAFLPSYATMLNAPDGWRWAGKHMIDNVLYIHGDNGRSGQYAHIHYMKQRKGSVVIGHIHAYAGVSYEADYFGMNAGCLIDHDAYCFKYAKNMLNGINLGCGLVFNGKAAYFIPMHTDENNRWTGKL